MSHCWRCSRERWRHTWSAGHRRLCLIKIGIAATKQNCSSLQQTGSTATTPLGGDAGLRRAQIVSDGTASLQHM